MFQCTLHVVVTNIEKTLLAWINCWYDWERKSHCEPLYNCVRLTTIIYLITYSISQYERIRVTPYMFPNFLETLCTIIVKKSIPEPVCRECCQRRGLPAELGYFEIACHGWKNSCADSLKLDWATFCLSAISSKNTSTLFSGRCRCEMMITYSSCPYTPEAFKLQPLRL